ncbi:uncharacterized protein METZ01_LOCUS161351, partial [marine metagenome]
MNKHIKFSTLFLSIFLFLAAIDASQSSELSKEKITLNDLN